MKKKQGNFSGFVYRFSPLKTKMMIPQRKAVIRPPLKFLTGKTSKSFGLKVNFSLVWVIVSNKKKVTKLFSLIG